MQILETFQQFSERKFKLFEQQSTGGFIVCFGCTDSNNVMPTVAAKLGIEADFEFSGKISGAEGFDNIAQEKSFAKVLKKGKAVTKGKDFLEIKSDGKTYTLNEKGLIQVPFTQGVGPVFEVRGSGNGLLVFMRAIQWFKVACGEGFDEKSPFDGTLLMQIGLPVNPDARKGSFIAINAKYTEPNSQRTGSNQYMEINDVFIQRYKKQSAKKGGAKKVKEGIDFIKIQEQEEKKATDQLIISGDSIADAIKGAQFIALNQKWKSKFSAYHGFNKMMNQEKENPEELTFTDDLEKASYYLAVGIQAIIEELKYKYPLNNMKIYNVDIMPQCSNILKAQGKDIKKFDASSIKQELTEIFKIFQPLQFPEFPEFKSKIPVYWSVLTNSIINRTLASMPKTYTDAMTPYIEGQGSATSGASSGRKNYGSGEF